MSPRDHHEAPMRGSHVVVTGASSGIGRAIATEMAKQGADHLLIHYCSNRIGAEETAREVVESGALATLCQADLSIENDRSHLVTTAFSKMPTVSAWVNNAGVDVLTGDLAQRGFEDKLGRLLSVDLMGTISLSRLVVDAWGDQEKYRCPPSMVFTSWDQATLGMEGDAGQMFGPVKAAVMAFAKNLAQSVAPQIRVNTVSPGWIKTAWGTDTRGYWDDRAKGQSLMGRWGTPEDVAQAVVFLCSPTNDFITGQVIEVNGGWNRRFERASDPQDS